MMASSRIQASQGGEEAENAPQGGYSVAVMGISGMILQATMLVFGA
jgi:hypothetical protein